MKIFPAEVIALVLRDVCELEDEEFEHEHGTGSAPQVNPARMAPLLVCRSWHEVACSPFYRTVILSTAVQARRFAFTLKRRPNLGISIRKLRFKGGFGSAPRKILQAAPQLTHLSISLAITSVDSIHGLLDSLPITQPRSLSLHDFNNDYNNNNTRRLLGVICFCMKTKWTKLIELRFPYEIGWSWKRKRKNVRDLLDAMYCAPFLQTVHMPGPYSCDHLRPLLAKPTFRAIYSETPFGIIAGHHIRGITDQLPIQQLELGHKIHFPLPGPWAPSRRPHGPLQVKSNNLNLMFRVLPPL